MKGIKIWRPSGSGIKLYGLKNKYTIRHRLPKLSKFIKDSGMISNHLYSMVYKNKEIFFTYFEESYLLVFLIKPEKDELPEIKELMEQLDVDLSNWIVDKKPLENLKYPMHLWYRNYCKLTNKYLKSSEYEGSYTALDIEDGKSIIKFHIKTKNDHSNDLKIITDKNKEKIDYNNVLEIDFIKILLFYGNRRQII